LEVLNFSGKTDTWHPIPEEIENLRSKIFEKTFEKVDQITANIYKSGDGIPPHVDNPYSFGSTISSVSLLSNVLFQFKRGNNIFEKYLKRKSLLIMTGESRYSYGMSIRQFEKF